jgi:single-strand DNA-binding protein
MSSFNKTIIMGNLTRDPEMRYTPKGTAVGKIGIAINRRYKDAEGNQLEETTFVDVDVFGKQAETIGKYMRKGRPILIEGRLKLDEWVDQKTQQNRSKLGVVCERFNFIGGKDENQETPTSEAPKKSPIDDDDVPF